MDSGERLAGIETAVAHINKTLDRIEGVLVKHVRDNEISFDGLGNKYASKGIEDIAKGSFLLVVGGIVTAVITLFN